ncbi:MAG: ATP-binding protein [Oscillospiraceae bacterium]|nr:ATP-binding protein [Oscillospiraceae bacterium]
MHEFAHEFSIAAKTENLDSVLNFVNAHIEHCPMKLQSQIGIVIDEVFANIASYAYNPNVGGVIVRLKVGDDIVIEFEDSGVPYDPLGSETPDITLGADEREIGGLGLFMVKSIMDSVEYKRNGCKNILTIKKQL